MEDSTSEALPILALAGFTLVTFVLVLWRRSSQAGGLSRRGVRNMGLLVGALFLVLLPLVLMALPERPVIENIGLALWIAIFITGTGVAMWLGGT